MLLNSKLVTMFEWTSWTNCFLQTRQLDGLAFSLGSDRAGDAHSAGFSASHGLCAGEGATLASVLCWGCREILHSVGRRALCLPFALDPYNYVYFLRFPARTSFSLEKRHGRRGNLGRLVEGKRDNRASCSWGVCSKQGLCCRFPWRVRVAFC